MTFERDSIELQSAAREFVNQHVVANVTTLVTYVLEKSVEDNDAPFSFDDVPLSLDTEEWTADQLMVFMQDEYGAEWETVTGEPWTKTVSQEAIDKMRQWLKDNHKETDLAAFHAAPLDEWDADTLRGFVYYCGNEWEEITGEDPPETEQERDERHEDEAEKARTYIHDNFGEKTVYEWWAVSEWLKDRLTEEGAVIFDASGAGLYVWGRQCTGQAIFLDGNIQNFTNTWLTMQAARAERVAKYAAEEAAYQAEKAARQAT